jgi:hypothetical protein
VSSKFEGWTSVKDFGAAGDGIADDLPAFLEALDHVDNTGGGILFVPRGIYRITSQLNVGNGSNLQQSTKQHRIRIFGTGAGVGTDVSSVQITGASTIIYDGRPDIDAAVLSLEGPLHNIGVEHLHLDCKGKAGTGLRINHVTHGKLDHLVVVNYAFLAYDFTCRDKYPAGVTYGNAENDCNFLSCYNPSNSKATGMRWTSGVNYKTTTLTGNPDTCRCHFRGGTLIYGGGVESYGLLVHGADNNTIIGTQIIPSGNNTGGIGVAFIQWEASPIFPLENVFTNVVATQGYIGDGGTGGNLVLALPQSNGTGVPAGKYIHTITHSGRFYVGGQRVF